MYSRRGHVFAPRKRKRWFRWVLLWFLLLFSLGGVYTAVDNGRVVVRTQQVVAHKLPPALEGYTVLHIADLNARRFGPGQKQLQNALKTRSYSAVCLTGDMVGPSADAYPLYELLTVLDPSKPVFMIAGDSDPVAVGGQQAGYYTVLAEWVIGAQARGAQFLGEPMVQEVGGARVWFSDAAQLFLDMDGASDAYAGSNTPVSAYYADILFKTRQARESMRDSDLHIALTHKPISLDASSLLLNVSDEGGSGFVRTVDAFLAGGTAGGQWRIPFVGPVWYEGWFPGDASVQGLSRAGILPQPQYISSGLGTDAKNPLPPIRLFNTPSVTLVTFTAHLDLE